MAGVSVYRRAQIHGATTMEIQADTNLGNQRRVHNFPVNRFDHQFGSATAPMIRRGKAIFLDPSVNGVDAHQHFGTKVLAGGAGRVFAANTPLVGVMAEAAADTHRRTPRPGRKAVPFHLPLTFQGVDIVTSAHPFEKAFVPGDPVFLEVSTGRVFPECPAYVEPGLCEMKMFLGVCHVNASAGADSVQVRVDTLDFLSGFDFQRTSGVLATQSKPNVQTGAGEVDADDSGDAEYLAAIRSKRD